VDGVLFAAVGRQFIDDFDIATVTDNASNSLSLHDEPHNYADKWPDSGIGCYVKFAATGRSGCIVTDSKPDSDNEITVIAINLIGATQIEDFAFTYDTTGPTNTSASITVTKPSVLVGVWGGDSAIGEQGPSFSTGWTRQQFSSLTNGAHVQMALATRVVDAGTYNFVATPQTSQGALTFIYGFN
jgi:hypothetical protein